MSNSSLTGARIGWKPFSYDFRVPSARYRSALPSRHLGRAGLRTSIVPPDGSGAYDCVVFQKSYSDGDISLAERYKSRGIKVAFDLCDNHFYAPGDDPKLLERAGRLRRMVDLADVVSVSTPPLATLLPEKQTFQVDDALEVPRGTALARGTGSVRRRLRPREPLRLVWFGTSGPANPPFGLVELRRILPELDALSRTLPLRLTVITDSRARFQEHTAGAELPIRFVKWKAETFAFHFTGNDLCLLPMTPGPYTSCRTSNRVRTALMLGLPVVATEIPSYREFSDWMLVERAASAGAADPLMTESAVPTFGDGTGDGVWAEHITMYVRDPELARRHVADAQRYIRDTYTSQRVVQQWTRVFEALLGERTRRP